MSAAQDFSGMRDLYQDIILHRSRNPAHQHRLDPFDARAEGSNPLCGDQVEIRLAYAEDGTVADAAFVARGCAISVASADLMVEAVTGRTPSDLRRLAAEFDTLAHTGQSDSTDPALKTLRPLSGVSEYRSRVKCATLPWTALIAALDGAPSNG